MSRNMCRALRAFGTVCCTLTASVASAQWYPGANPCACAQPVVQPCYQTVPVTEFREFTEVVQRPVYETKYVEQPYTEYEPVVQQRTVQVPTVDYQTVTECQTVQRDAGYWATSYQPNCKVAPCQYDPRPGVLGWLNRTGYSIRSSFTPNYTVNRQYVPRTIVQQVPTTRTVAVRGVREVTVNETRYVARQRTRKVAVQSVRYEKQTVTARRPVTVMRTVPIGSQMAYAITPFGSTQSALVPTPDAISAEKADRDRTARRPDPFEEDSKETTIPGKQFRRTPVDSSARDSEFKRSSYRTPLNAPDTLQAPTARRKPQGEVSPSPSVAKRTNSVPSIVRVSGWTARSRRSRDSVNGPELDSPALSVVRNDH